MDSLFFLALPRQAVLPKWNKSFSFKEQVDPQAGDVSRRPSNANGLTVSLQVDPKDDSSRKGSYGSQFSDDMDIAPYMPPPPYAQLRQVSVSSGRGLLRKDSDSPSLATSSTMSSRQGSFAGSEHLSEKKTPAPEVYHVFTSSQKRRLIYLVSAAALFSPLSSNIYFPALAQISEDLHTPIEQLGFTITIYMIVQGISPSFWGALADQIGRRQIFIWTFVVYLVANIGLGLTQNFAMLMVFRGLQAAGSAATISIGAGVIGDITTAKERGNYIGIFSGLRMMGQSVGPILGGLISQYLGYRSIFWFLLGLGALSLLSIVIFLPETLRSIAGGGTVQLTGRNKPLWYNIHPQQPADALTAPVETKTKITFRSMISPLRFLFEKDVFITLFFGAIVYTVWSMVTSSTTALLTEHYNLPTVIIGLCFLPNGAGCVAGSLITGKILDWDYRRTEKEYKQAHNLPHSTTLNKKALSDFPIEKARLRSSYPLITTFILTTALYGYSIRSHILALPLILQFFIAYTATAIFTQNSALVVDLYPGKSASATACNNLIRCLIGAVGVAVVQYAIDGVGVGPCFLLLAGLTAVVTPCVWVELRWGMEWRRERGARLARRDLEAGTVVETVAVVDEEKK